MFDFLVFGMDALCASVLIDTVMDNAFAFHWS
jgi:hypothetical protein